MMKVFDFMRFNGWLLDLWFVSAYNYKHNGNAGKRLTNLSWCDIITDAAYVRSNWETKPYVASFYKRK